ncbi:MAG: antibiotic biosynthesis monooxygenase [Planctomycetes bacterium]|nr:antibiotic biosynthesis monooxygenase [Planctomycetota bacterium]
MSTPTDPDSRPGPATTPDPPYWAVIFSSRLGDDQAGYDAAAARMLELARVQAGFLGVESARGADGLGLTVSYWTDRAAVASWRAHAEHALVREQGVSRWYMRYRLRVALVEHESVFERD